MSLNDTKIRSLKPSAKPFQRYWLSPTHINKAHSFATYSVFLNKLSGCQFMTVGQQFVYFFWRQWPRQDHTDPVLFIHMISRQNAVFLA